MVTTDIGVFVLGTKAKFEAGVPAVRFVKKNAKESE